MVLGTSSSAGKSTLVTGLCRHFARAGIRVAPFKAQNMSLNSAATPEGLEIGRAQALQAEAAGLAPSADHNPVLIKPSANGAQLVVHGRMAGRVVPSDYLGRNKQRLWPSVLESYERLARTYELIVIEGAGSPAEINLREGDIVNLAMAHAADARCILIGDIDRGGVFAAIYGTLALLDEADRARIHGWAVNKFRGDVQVLAPGITMLEARIEKPCVGIVPHLGEIGLEEEDGVALEELHRLRSTWNDRGGDRRLRVAVVALPYLANFTDFDALSREPSVDLRYVSDPRQLAFADAIVLPGSKDTIADLRWLRGRGLAEATIDLARTRIVVGICAGMQMLGRRVDDPSGVESGGSHEGLGILGLTTTLASAKTTVPIEGFVVAERICGVVPAHRTIRGYEIHVGETSYDAAEPFAAISRNGALQQRRDGAVARDGCIVGTYAHGLFAGDGFRHAFVDAARAYAHLGPAAEYAFVERDRAQRFDRLADAVAEAIDLRTLLPSELCEHA